MTQCHSLILGYAYKCVVSQQDDNNGRYGGNVSRGVSDLAVRVATMKQASASSVIQGGGRSVSHLKPQQAHRARRVVALMLAHGVGESSLDSPLRTSVDVDKLLQLSRFLAEVAGQQPQCADGHSAA
jgi:hypothetical protein